MTSAEAAGMGSMGRGRGRERRMDRLGRGGWGYVFILLRVIWGFGWMEGGKERREANGNTEYGDEVRDGFREES